MNKRLIGVIALAAFLAACSSKKVKEEPAPAVEDKSPTTQSQPAAPATSGMDESASTASAGSSEGSVNPLTDPNNILSKRSIYFEFDSFTVADQYKPIVEAHARYLAANRGARVTLQGHAEERGSREYNIALGQKRADAVKRMMTVMGIQETVVETVSFGKEKPRNMGHDEAAWAENRRVDIIYAGE